MTSKSSSCLHGDLPSGEGVVRAGCMKKMKTSKKKYFVLREENKDSSARLEYYDSEKKFMSGQAPKRSIPLKTCFNINKQNDTKHKHVIALYTKDDRFCVVLENEENLDAWLKALLSQQRGEDVPDGETPRPTFEHVWQVLVCNRGIGATNYTHNQMYRLCLTDKTLSLIKKDCMVPHTELSLSSIRSCGSAGIYFYLEVGRSSSVGAGELWLETEDQTIAQNVQQTVFHAMSSSSREELGPKSRNRSSSATESSKPCTELSVRDRRQTLTGATKPTPHSQDHPPLVSEAPVPSSSTNNTTDVSGMLQYNLRSVYVLKTSERRHSIAAGNNAPWPGIVNHQRTRSLPLAHPAPITTVTIEPLHPPRTVAKRTTTNQSSKCFVDGRVRSDSMPSRARTTSEGNPNHMGFEKYSKVYRPQSIHGRDISHSPPSGSPVSPPSAASTDSAGSSLSIDEPWPSNDMHEVRRYGTSLTPDDPIVEEHCENCIDSLCAIHSSTTPSSYVRMQPISSDDGYVDMSPRGRHQTMSPAASMSSVTSGTPSTDMRFVEYPLEKVTSYFTRSEEEETSSAERPRTYSMGSRPFKSRIEAARDRAWSVGSKGKKIFNRVLPPHGPHVHAGPKSSSAPMLSNTQLHSSHSSIDPMDDLMELDFTRTTISGYMDMRLGEQKQSRTPTTSTSSVGYLSMRPGHNVEHPDTSSYVPMCPGSSPAKPTTIHQSDANHESARPDYMDMDSRRSVRMCRIASVSPKNHPSVSPLSSIASTSPVSQYTPQTEYMDMNFSQQQQQARNAQTDTYVASPVKSTLSGYSQGSPSSIEYIDMDCSATTPTRNQPKEDYVQMSLGTSATQSDYTNMSLGASATKKKERKLKKVRSQPITIQNAPLIKPPTMTSPIFSFSLRNRKYSAGTPPIMHLPLATSTSPCSSLPRDRPRSRKNSRRDSKDSSSSSVTTPSSTTTMFPISINSPSSPLSNSPSSEAKSAKIKIPAAIINAKYNQSSSGFRHIKDEYAPMNFGRPSTTPTDTSDYVNYSPAITTNNSTSAKTNDYALMKPNNNRSDYALMMLGQSSDYAYVPPSNDYGNYAPMVPGESRLPSRIPARIPSRVPHLVPQVADLHLDESARTFSANDIKIMQMWRPGSESSEVGSTSSNVANSRPGSVNSDKVRESDGQLHYARLDLPESDAKSNAAKTSGDTQTSQNTTQGFTYAEIDFVKSEGMKANHLVNTSANANTKWFNNF